MLYGGAGFNTAVYAGKRAQFTITHSASNVVVVTDSKGAEGQDTLADIQQLRFADGGVILGIGGSYTTVAKVVVASTGTTGLSNAANAGTALRLLADGMSETQLLKLASLTPSSSVDLSVLASNGMEYGAMMQQHVEQAYRLYQAAFNRTPDFGGVAFWTNILDKGLSSLDAVAQGFLQSPEFQSTYGNLDTLHYVDQLYMNVLHRLPDSGGESFWVSNLNAAALTRAQTLAQFSESPENQANLVGVLNHGAVSA